MGNSISSLLNKTVGGWLLIVVISGIGGYRYYLDQQKKANKQNARLKGREVQANQPKKDNKAKKQRVESFASQNKAQPKSYAAATTASTPEVKAVPSKSRDEVDDRTFAQQMANNKQNKFVTKTTSEQKHKQKSVKQSKAKEINEVNKESAPSSNDGAEVEAEAEAEADDDQSPVTSPSIAAADATGVSDMLEQPSTGPSVLRLTGTDEKPKKTKKTKAPEPTETKKQRQNRQKREQEKAFREEQEKERRVLEEAQRRTARQAEGRAAKDGSAFAAAQKANAWADKIANGDSQKAAPAVYQPLDTFDDTRKAAPATTNGSDNKENVKQNGKKIDWTENPYTEEQQLKMFEAEDDSKWQSVETKKAKKAKKTSAGVASSEDGSVNETPTPAAAPAVATSPPTKSKATPTNGRPKAQAMPNSFGALAVQDTGSEEEQAQEWDV